MDKLYDYQKEILNEAILLNNGSIDIPMGSGKTIISLVLALEQYKLYNSPVLIIVSKSLLSNWKNEIDKFFKNGLNYIILHKDYIKNIDNYTIESSIKIIITTADFTSKCYKSNLLIKSKLINTYHIPIVNNLTREVLEFNMIDIPILSKMDNIYSYIYHIQFSSLIIDEIQNYTNFDAIKCKSLVAISSNSRYGLSGTLFNEPKTKKLFGYYLLTNSLNIPRRFDLAESYFKSDSFNGYLSSVIHRDTIPNFKKPEINTTVITHDATDDEIILYQSMKKCIKIIAKYVNMYSMNNNYNSTNSRLYRAYILTMVTYFRQMIITPILPIAKCFLDSIDTNANSELTNIIIGEFEKLNLSSYLNNESNLISSRVKKIQEMVHKHNEELIIIFTCFRVNLDIMFDILDDTRPKFKISSDMTSIERDSIINSFKLSENGLLYLTYDIGAEGLNLQFCKTILFADLYWNMGKIDQAKARILRPGQLSDHINIYYFISNLGIEKSILQKHKDKLIIIDEIKTGKMKTTVKTISMKDIIKMIDDGDNLDMMNKNLNL